MYRILVVDDEPMIRKGLHKLIGEADPAVCHAETADNGQDALDKIAANRPDLLFTDIKMPKMDGLELCRQVNERFPDLPVVIISGYGDFEYARQCMSFGVKEYLLKPVTKAAVSQTVAKLIAGLEARRQAAYIPLKLTEEWLDRLQDGIWYLRLESIKAAIMNIEQYCTLCKFDAQMVGELMQELSGKLADRLNARDVYPFERPLRLADRDSAAIAWLGDSATLMMEQLRAKRKGNLKDPVEEAKSYIEQHLGRELSLEEVADKLGLNASYFSQLFKQMTNETFVQYRTKRRMERAKRLLSMPHHKITDVSAEVGFADHPHFTKTFKKYSGQTPSEYRESLGIRG
ncbi:response regulator [Paenibacillus sp. CF384]|uniref:response regulator transcription factor n=1 Tax=Paenibacillus sp. CF384 TaxID=1884382 RepID=UPI00089BF6C3|nr:response regulator [Paenibacillus sp. CF384]SDX08851.1 two-component system, response regulator YesN [Paenibacillus sp. CF384]